MPLPLNSFPPADPVSLLSSGPLPASGPLGATTTAEGTVSFSSVLQRADSPETGLFLEEIATPADSGEQPVPGSILAGADQQLAMMMAFMVTPPVQTATSPAQTVPPLQPKNLAGDVNFDGVVVEGATCESLAIGGALTSSVPGKFVTLGGKPVRQQLADGAPVIEFQLPASEVQSTAPDTPKSDTPVSVHEQSAGPDAHRIQAPASKVSAQAKGTGLPLPSAEASALPLSPSVLPAETASASSLAPHMAEAPTEMRGVGSLPAAGVAASSTVTAVMSVTENQLTPGGQTRVADLRVKGQAKIAAKSPVGTVAPASGGNSPTSSQKNQFLVIEKEQVMSQQSLVGMGGANRESAMSIDSHFRSSFALPDAAQAVDLAGGAAQTWSRESVAAPSDVRPAVSLHAAEVVREIRDIADGLWTTERNSVEVRFRFGEGEHLAVKVEYRDGAVHATFRTNSPELRDTLAQEWQVQAAGVEPRPYRLAEPVFNAAPASGSPSQFTAGDDARQQRSSEHAPVFNQTWPGMPGRRDETAARSSVAVPSIHKPDTSLHLHTFA